MFVLDHHHPRIIKIYSSTGSTVFVHLAAEFSSFLGRHQQHCKLASVVGDPLLLRQQRRSSLGRRPARSSSVSPTWSNLRDMRGPAEPARLWDAHATRTRVSCCCLCLTDRAERTNPMRCAPHCLDSNLMPGLNLIKVD